MTSVNPARHARAFPAGSLPPMARGLFYRVASEEGRIVQQVGTGVVIDGASNVPRRPPPRLGKHTDAVLRDLRGPAQSQARQTEGNTR